MRITNVLLSLGLVTSLAGPAVAQTAPKPMPKPVAKQPTVTARGYVVYGPTTVLATETFDALTGTTRRSGFGGGGMIAFRPGLFVDAAFSQQKFTGERVFVDDGTVFKLGTPLRIEVRPIDVAAGWRLFKPRWSPYVGGGVTFISYEETADFAESGDDVSESGTGLLALAGVDVALVRWIHVGAEFRYRTVSGILGSGGVSEVFGEDKLGGYALALRISVGR